MAGEKMRALLIVGSFILFCTSLLSGENLDLEKTESASLPSIEFREAQLADVIRVLAKKANLNVIFNAEQMKGLISVRLANITAENALQAILEAQGYSLLKEEEVCYIGAGHTLHFVLDYIEVETVEAGLKAIISEGGKIIINKKSNAITVVDIPSKIRQVKQYLKQVDSQPLQVMIETLIVSVSLGNEQEFGIDWQYQSPETRPREHDMDLHVALPQDLGDEGGIFKIGTLGKEEYAVTIQMLKGENDVELLSHPRITTLDREQARINVVTTWPVPERTFNEDIGRWELTGWSELEYGVTLEVTPTVCRDRFILMKIHPVISDKIGDVVEAGDTRPILSKQEAETQILVEDNQTIVIGGLIKDKKSKTSKGIPLLGDIPLIGRLFKRTDDETVKTDLLIFITGHIMRPGELAERDNLRLKQLQSKAQVMTKKERRKVANLYYSSGLEYYRERKYPEAVETFRKVLEVDPGNRRAERYLKRACARLERERKDEIQ